MNDARDTTGWVSGVRDLGLDMRSNDISCPTPDGVTGPLLAYRKRSPRCWPAGFVARRCADDDAEALWVLFAQDGFRRFAMMDEMYFETPETVRCWLDANKPRAFHIVGSIGASLVGFGGLYPLSGRQSHVGSLTLTVHEGFHGKGVGACMLRLLLTTAEVWAGLRRVQLHVLADNRDALSLYRAFGFRTEGVHNAHVRSGDGYVGVLTMALTFQSGPSDA